MRTSAHFISMMYAATLLYCEPIERDSKDSNGWNQRVHELKGTLIMI